MSDGWIEVTGRRSFKQRDNRNNRKNNFKERDSDPDESKVNQNYEKIKKEIQNVYENTQPFLSKLLSGIKRSFKSDNVYLYALGCGTIENTSMVLSKSCLYQWAVCIILVKVLKITKVHIFDPVMTKNDHLVWNKLMESSYEFKDSQNLINDLYTLPSHTDPESNTDHNKDTKVSSTCCRPSSTNLPGHTSSSSCVSSDSSLPNSFSVHSKSPLSPDCSSSDSSESTHVLLWMPHCEKFLYKAVLEGLLENKCPLQLSKLLANQSDCCTNKHFVDSSTQHPQSFSLEHTTLVGNSLSEYSPDDLSFKDLYTLNESSLLPFDIHNQSFNDTFITTFTRNT